jgi:hypothetical protein
MAKADDFISPANLWGRPLPGSTSKPAETAPKKKEAKSTRMRKDEDYEDEDEDIRETAAELDDADVDAELDDQAEEAYAEAEELETEAEDDVDEENADDTEYAPEEGDEEAVVAEDDSDAETVEDDVTADDEEPVTARAGTKKKGSETMATKKSGADHIREEIERRQEEGESLRGVDIVSALAKKRVTVSPAQVSQLLKKAGVAGTRGEKSGAGEEKSRVAAKNKKPAEVAQPRVAPKRPVATAPSKTTTLPMDQLKAATAFLEACDGCYDSASDILKAHRQLGEMMSR